jgi:hypothetical protein
MIKLSLLNSQAVIKSKCIKCMNALVKPHPRHFTLKICTDKHIDSPVSKKSAGKNNKTKGVANNKINNTLIRDFLILFASKNYYKGMNYSRNSTKQC